MCRIYSDKQYIRESYESLENTRSYLIRQINYNWTTEVDKKKLIESLDEVEYMIEELESCVYGEDYERFFNETKCYWEGR